MNSEQLRNYSYFFFFLGAVFFCLFVSFVVAGKFSTNYLATTLFLAIAFVQIRTGMHFRRKSHEESK